MYPQDEPDPKELEKSVERTEMVSRGSYIIREAGAIERGTEAITIYLLSIHTCAVVCVPDARTKMQYSLKHFSQSEKYLKT